LQAPDLSLALKELRDPHGTMAVWSLFGTLVYGFIQASEYKFMLRLAFTPQI